MLIAQNITYIHPDREPLFENLSLSFARREKLALTGNNGSGKSTLLKILAGLREPSQGTILRDSEPYYIPQHFGQYNDHTIAQALHIEDRLNALYDILRGNVSGENLAVLNEDWTIEERAREAFAFWGLPDFPLSQKMEALSGGEKTKIFLAGLLIHKPELVLLDEPTNHLDGRSRQTLYDYIDNSTDTLIVVSHDRQLLNLLNPVVELDSRGISVYGGNYDFYREQKETEANALLHAFKSRENALKKAIRTGRETAERKQKLDARGKRKQLAAGTPKIMMNTLRNRAERSTSRLKDNHEEKIAHISEDLRQARQMIPADATMKMDFADPALQKGKVFVTANDINFAYGGAPLWSRPLSFEIRSGDRLGIRGGNGSGKTTLIKMILGLLQPSSGSISRAALRWVYIDQDYSLIRNDLSVYEQAQEYNLDRLPEHELKIRLSRFLFGKEFWDKPCASLSGGEKMRLMLCCMMIGNHAPDLFVLDEPTNNLDIRNIEILTSALSEYRGTVIVVSHDSYFITETGVGTILELDQETV